jgi:murein DD-endopeptidase MepM/ murein hydrolase activator NlpD
MDTIGASVGLHGQNRFADVYLIQRLLNHNRPRVPDARELAVDGKVHAKAVPDYHPPKGRITHHRYFGADRKAKGGGKRLHAACDLVVRGGTEALAIDDGRVSRYEAGFFENTGALVAVHSNGLEVRYGELSGPATGIGHKTSIKRGQVIGYVGTNLQGTAMLHIEFYAGTEEGPLSRGGGGFYRRADLINPTDYLDAATVDKSTGT